MRKNYYIIFLFLLLMTPLSSLKATHIIGGEISYECLGNNQFRITIKIYRDCLLGQAPYDNPLTISVFNAQNQLVQNIAIPYPGSVRLPAVASNPCIEVTGDVCVEEAIYIRTVTLPPDPNGYTLSYQRCCRNNSIINLVSPESTGATYSINIPGSAFDNCNNSPVYNNFPPVLLCANEPLIFDHSANDAEGDSLVYSFCSPLEGATTTSPMPVPAAQPPYNFVIFSPPYSNSYPIASDPAFSLDPNTGLLTGTPTQLGQYVVGVCVEEYRNGTLLSVNKRDFQFNVVSCVYNVTSQFTSPLIEVDPDEDYCNGLEVVFINQSQNATSFYWDFGVPNVDNDISTLAEPVFTYPDTGTYTIMLVANPDLPCADTSYSTIRLHRELITTLTGIEPQCIVNNSFNFNVEGEISINAIYEWDFGSNSNIQYSNLRSPENISFNEAGDYWIYLNIVTPYCQSFDSLLVTLYPKFEVDLTQPPGTGCQPYGVQFINNSITSPGATFLWTFGDGNYSTESSPYHIYPNADLYDVSVKIVNNFGCIDSAEIFYPELINVLRSPEAGISAEPLIENILTPYITFSDLSTDVLGCTLYPGDGNLLVNCNSMYTYTDTGTFDAYLVAVNELGCKDTAGIKVKIEPNFSFYVPNAFSPNGDFVNDFFYAKGEGIKEYEMLIFNRWGNIVFRCNDINEKWDGFVNKGKDEAPVDVYVYKVILVDVFNERKTYVGKVTLVR